MKKYMVAVGDCSGNEVKEVYAVDEVEAMAVAVGHREEWGYDDVLPFGTVEDGVLYYLQADVNVSPPFLVGNAVQVNDSVKSIVRVLGEQGYTGADIYLGYEGVTDKAFLGESSSMQVLRKVIGKEELLNYLIES